MPATQAPPPPEEAIMAARAAARSAATLEDLRAILNGFEGCALKTTAKQLVFGDGSPNARLMFVGEAPGSEEDQQGIPFVGRSGQLLDKMLAAIGIARADVYIANIVPWRPPGNRDPSLHESQICLPFIQRQIELVDPDVLVCLGKPSMATLLGVTDGIRRTRGRWFPFHTGTREIRASRNVSSRLSVANPDRETVRMEGFPGDEEGAGELERNQDRAGRDQRDTEPVQCSKLFAQEHDAEDCNQHHAELVNRRHLRCLSDLERAEITEPGRAGRKPGENEKQPGPSRDRRRRLELTARDQYGGE